MRSTAWTCRGSASRNRREPSWLDDGERPAILPSATMANTDKKPRIYGMSFGSVYPLYVQKAEKKGRTKEEVDEIIT